MSERLLSACCFIIEVRPDHRGGDLGGNIEDSVASGLEAGEVGKDSAVLPDASNALPERVFATRIPSALSNALTSQFQSSEPQSSGTLRPGPPADPPLPLPRAFRHNLRGYR